MDCKDQVRTMQRKYRQRMPSASIFRMNGVREKLREGD
jgi:hypothetical protein